MMRTPCKRDIQIPESHAFFVGIAPPYHTIGIVLAAESFVLTSQHAL